MAADQLGEIRREFRPGLDNLIAGIIIGVLLIGGGCLLVYFPVSRVIEREGQLPVWADKEFSWGAGAIFAILGIGLIVGGLFLIRWIRSLFSFRVFIGQNGLAAIDKKTARVFGWDGIASVQETRLYERPPILKGVAKYALPKMMSKSYVVKLKEGEPFGFDGNTVKGHTKLAELIRAETEPRQIPWEIVEEHGY